jgi:hypothetical protein
MLDMDHLGHARQLFRNQEGPAANGDQLFGSVVGGFISPNTATGIYAFTGGTGRFANATGGAEFVISTPDGVHFSVEFKGTLSSVGSNKP